VLTWWSRKHVAERSPLHADEIAEKSPAKFEDKDDNECSYNLMRVTHKVSEHHHHSCCGG
jgi:mannose-6-phosphate isomerase-like protein (cupin superfamily)